MTIDADETVRVERRHRSRALIAAVPLLVVAVVGAGVWLSTRPRADVPTAVAPIAMSLALGTFTALAADAAAMRVAASVGDALATSLRAVERSVRVVSTSPSAETAADLLEAARGAGARYLVEGDVRSAGEGRVTLSMRLTETVLGTPSWSDRFDIPAAGGSDESAMASRHMVEDVARAVSTVETARVQALPLDRLDATELALRAEAIGAQTPALANALDMRRLLEAALQLEPGLVLALRDLVRAIDYLHDVDPHPDHGRYVREIDEVTARVLVLDPDDSGGWAERAAALMALGQWRASLEANQRSIDLDPHSYRGVEQRAWLMNMVAQPAEALQWVDKAYALRPSNPQGILRAVCEAHLLLGQAEKAVETCRHANGRDPSDRLSGSFLAAAYANAGHLERARAQLKLVSKAVPGYTLAQLRAKRYSDHPEYQRLAERYWYAGLRKAGLAEK